MERPAGGGSAPSPWTPSRLFIGTATRSCATPPLPQHRTRRQQKAPSKHTSAARPASSLPLFCLPPNIYSYLLLPGYYRSCCTFATTTTTHLCYRYHYTHYGHCLYHSHYRLCCTIATTTTTVHTTLRHPPELSRLDSTMLYIYIKRRQPTSTFVRGSMERPAGGGAAPSPPAPPSRLFIGTATRSCATPPLPQHHTRRQQKHHQSTQAQLVGVVVGDVVVGVVVGIAGVVVGVVVVGVVVGVVVVVEAVGAGTRNE